MHISMGDIKGKEQVYNKFECSGATIFVYVSMHVCWCVCVLKRANMPFKYNLSSVFFKKGFSTSLTYTYTDVHRCYHQMLSYRVLYHRTSSGVVFAVCLHNVDSPVMHLKGCEVSLRVWLVQRWERLGVGRGEA